MSSIDCIKDHGNNCVKSGRCPEGTSCCIENTPNGTPKLGLCVKNGYCNKKTGLPKSDCRDSEKTPQLIQEDYISGKTYSRENYTDCNCDTDQCDETPLYILSFLVVLLLSGFVWKKVCDK